MKFNTRGKGEHCGECNRPYTKENPRAGYKYQTKTQTGIWMCLKCAPGVPKATKIYEFQRWIVRR